MTSIDLNGSDWRLKGFLPSGWVRPDLADVALADTRDWVSASVPGSVQHDLWQAGSIDDPYVGRNSLAAEWVADRTWVYTRRFDADPAWQGRRMRLRFDGIDYAARIVLNGVLLGEHESMSTAAVFEVSGSLRYDEANELVVILAPAPREQDQMGRTSLVRTRKTRMGYWWDFCPRIVNLGLWESVTLEITGSTCIEDVAVQPALSEDRRSAAVTVQVALTAALGTEGTVEVTLHHDGEQVAAGAVPFACEAGLAHISVDLTIADPQLWWPNGYGAQALYRAEVRVLNATDAGDVSDAGNVTDAGDVSDERGTSFGIRSLEVVTNDTDDETAPPYTFVVNGERVYINGWNWVPIDALYGVPRAEKLTHLLELAAQANANLLRVNGVGVVGGTEFYDHCDRLGIMVWQEFVVTSSATDRKPSEEPGYIAEVVDEARRIVPKRRNHPSLVIWCAGNELESLDKLPLDDTEPLIGALRDVARELDPDTVWLPTSARGRKPFNGLSSIQRDPDGLHDVHGPWLYEGLTDQYTLYNAGTSLFHSELGCEAISNPETLRDVLPPDELSLDRLESPVWRHLSAWWVRPDVWNDIFGTVDDLDQLVAATQALQAEGVRYALESNRRRAYRNSGSLPWQFNEPYPMVGSTAAVDYYGRPKALYYAVAAAYEPVALSARYDTIAWGGRDSVDVEVWVASALRESISGATLLARIVDAHGASCASESLSIDVPADSPARLTALSVPLGDIPTDVFLVDLSLVDASGVPRAANRVAFSRTSTLAPFVQLAETQLDARLTADASTGDRASIVLTNTGEEPALFVRLADARDVRAAGYAYFEGNSLSLLPGESRTVGVTWRNVPLADRILEISALNVRASRLV